MIKALNLGCGDDLRASTSEIEWTNADIRQSGKGLHMILDMLQLPWPFADGLFDYILADNVLEHFRSEDFIRILNEINRVVKVGGRVEIIVPHAFSQGAYQDPTHKMFFVPRSALYWNQVQTPFGGRAVGITANLACDPAKIEVKGSMATEAFIHYKLVRLEEQR
jgi:SAM-dependent methyltransferase